MLAPGIMHAAYLQPARNWVRHWAAGTRNLEPIRGCDIYEYVQVVNPNAFIIIPECCIWYDPRMLDDRPSGITLGDALDYAARSTRAAQEFVGEIWRAAQPQLTVHTPWRKMVEEKTDAREAAYTNVSDPPFTFERQDRARKITVAEEIGIKGHDDIYRLFELGSMYRLLDAEYAASANDDIGTLRDQVRDRLVVDDRFLHANYQVVNTPIRNLIGMGVGALLEAAQYAKTLER
jgi:hypothetical protein